MSTAVKWSAGAPCRGGSLPDILHGTHLTNFKILLLLVCGLFLYVSRLLDVAAP